MCVVMLTVLPVLTVTAAGRVVYPVNTPQTPVQRPVLVCVSLRFSAGLTTVMAHTCTHAYMDTIIKCFVEMSNNSQSQNV